MLQAVETSDGESCGPAETRVEVDSPEDVSTLAIEFQVLWFAGVLRLRHAIDCSHSAKVNVIHIGYADGFLLLRCHHHAPLGSPLT